MSFLQPPQPFQQQQQQVAKRSYGQCDSFFIDTDDGASHERRLDAKEKAKIGHHDMLEHMEHMERETSADVNSIEIQTEIQWYMRPYLLDFLIEAHSAFQLMPETLYLTVNILDRYCSKRVVYKRHYQLVGCAALLIAAKYGDRKDRVPTVRELKGMCCSLYEDEMFTQMEYHVLATLNWMIGHPTVDSFLQLALLDAPHDAEVEHMTWYICEIALFHKEFVSILPSVLARSALALARCVLSRSIPSQSEWSSNYDPVVVVNLSNKVSSPSAVLSTKYAAPNMSYVSNTLHQFIQQQAQLSIQTTPPTPPLEMDIEVADKSPMDVHYMPHTPQKGQHLLNNAHGYMTPPITPDYDLNNVGGVHCKGYAPASAPQPPTPTPSSAMDQNYPNQHRYDSLKLPVPRPTYEQPTSARDYQHNPWNAVTMPAVQIDHPAYYGL